MRSYTWNSSVALLIPTCLNCPLFASEPSPRAPERKIDTVNITISRWNCPPEPQGTKLSLSLMWRSGMIIVTLAWPCLTNFIYFLPTYLFTELWAWHYSAQACFSNYATISISLSSSTINITTKYYVRTASTSNAGSIERMQHCTVT